MLDNLLLAPNFGFEKETIDWVKGKVGCQTLKALSRMAIRQCVQAQFPDCSVYDALWKLPLPTILKRCIRLDEYELSNQISPSFVIPQQCVCCLDGFSADQ